MVWCEASHQTAYTTHPSSAQSSDDDGVGVVWCEASHQTAEFFALDILMAVYRHIVLCIGQKCHLVVANVCTVLC